MEEAAHKGLNVSEADRVAVELGHGVEIHRIALERAFIKVIYR